MNNDALRELAEIAYDAFKLLPSKDKDRFCIRWIDAQKHAVTAARPPAGGVTDEMVELALDAGVNACMTVVDFFKDDWTDEETAGAMRAALEAILPHLLAQGGVAKRLDAEYLLIGYGESDLPQAVTCSASGLRAALVELIAGEDSDVHREELDGHVAYILDEENWNGGFMEPIEFEIGGVRGYRINGPTASRTDDAQAHIRDHHKTVPILVWADIDEGVADMVRYLNTIPGVRTEASCQGTIGEGGPHPYRAQVLTIWPKEQEARLLAEFDLHETNRGECWGYLHPREGWTAQPKPADVEKVMVPREPTEAMLLVVDELRPAHGPPGTLTDDFILQWRKRHRRNACELYAAMLAAVSEKTK